MSTDCNTLNTTPKEDGFYMPAEWTEHQMCFIGFPLRDDNWRENAEPAQKAFVEIAKAISEFEPVTVCCPPQIYEKCRLMFPENINILSLEQNDCWLRDTGPTFVKNNNIIRGVDWKFNAWGGLDGGCYNDWSLDTLVAGNILKYKQCDRYSVNMILEGGSIHTDGCGTIITTEECLLNKNRNPNLNKNEIENIILNYTGCNKIIWLKNGLYGDIDTNGHIDNICAFIKPCEVVLCWTDDINDPQYNISREAEKILLESTDALNRKIRIHKIPIPTILYRTKIELNGINICDGTITRDIDRLPGSYINFYICNNGLILPSFNVPTDIIVYDLFQKLLPERKIIMVPGREILLGGGNIHCITQQMPK